MDLESQMSAEDRSALADRIIEWLPNVRIGPPDPDPEKELIRRVLFTVWGFLWLSAPDDRRLVRRTLQLEPEEGDPSRRMMPQPGEPSPGFFAEPGRCWRLIYNHNLQVPAWSKRHSRGPIR